MDKQPDSRFGDVLLMLAETHEMKSRFYGTYGSGTYDDDAYANLRASVDWCDTPAWVGACMRASDKSIRLQQYAREWPEAKIPCESAADDLLDAAAYYIIAYILHEEEIEIMRHNELTDAADREYPDDDLDD